MAHRAKIIQLVGDQGLAHYTGVEILFREVVKFVAGGGKVDTGSSGGGGRGTMSREIDFQTVFIRGEERLEIRVLRMERAGIHGMRWTWVIGNSGEITSTGPFNRFCASAMAFEPTAVEFRFGGIVVRREQEEWLRTAKAAREMEQRIRDADPDDEEFIDWDADRFAALIAAKMVSLEDELFASAYREELHNHGCQVIRAREPSACG